MLCDRMVVSMYNLYQFQVPEYEFPLFSIRSIKVCVIKLLMTNCLINLIRINITSSVDSVLVVSIMTVVRDGRSWIAIPARDKEIFSLPQYPERYEDSIIIFKGRLFPEGSERSDRTADHSI